MANKIVFTPYNHRPYVLEHRIEYEFQPGLNKVIAQRNSARVSQNWCTQPNRTPPLEISTAGTCAFGRSLSAFNLNVTLEVNGQQITRTVEAWYQSAKVFKHASPNHTANQFAYLFDLPGGRLLKPKTDVKANLALLLERHIELPTDVKSRNKMITTLRKAFVEKHFAWAHTKALKTVLTPVIFAQEFSKDSTRSLPINTVAMNKAINKVKRYLTAPDKMNTALGKQLESVLGTDIEYLPYDDNISPQENRSRRDHAKKLIEQWIEIEREQYNQQWVRRILKDQLYCSESQINNWLSNVTKWNCQKLNGIFQKYLNHEIDDDAWIRSELGDHVITARGFKPEALTPEQISELRTQNIKGELRLQRWYKIADQFRKAFKEALCSAYTTWFPNRNNVEKVWLDETSWSKNFWVLEKKNAQSITITIKTLKLWQNKYNIPLAKIIYWLQTGIIAQTDSSQTTSKVFGFTEDDIARINYQSGNSEPIDKMDKWHQEFRSALQMVFQHQNLQRFQEENFTFEQFLHSHVDVLYERLLLYQNINNTYVYWEWLHDIQSNPLPKQEDEDLPHEEQPVDEEPKQDAITKREANQKYIQKHIYNWLRGNKKLNAQCQILLARTPLFKKLQGLGPVVHFKLLHLDQIWSFKEVNDPYNIFTWLYFTGLLQKEGALKKLSTYDAFMDIFNVTDQTENCQARAAAMAVQLYRNQQENTKDELTFEGIMESKETFEAFMRDAYRYQNNGSVNREYGEY